MQRLQPAGVFSQFVSSIFRKTLNVEIQTETLSDGTVEVVPVYTVDGLLVPSDQLTYSQLQTVMGHSVTATPAALTVLEETGGKTVRLSKHKTAAFLQQMDRQGVRLRAKGKNAPPQIASVQPELQLQLHEDDSLTVSSQLVTQKGVIVEKPTNLEDLAKENGWFVAGQDLYKVETTGNSIDSLLLTTFETTQLVGDDVPRFLKDVAASEAKFSAIEKNERLSGLSVYGDRHENRLAVTGDSHSIQIQPSLVYVGKDGVPHEPAPAIMEKAANGFRGFERVPEGWIEVLPEVVAKHRSDVDDVKGRLGPFEDISSSRVPETLSKLLNRNSFASPWAVYFSDEVKNSHRLVDAAAETRFSLNVVESDGRALLELDPRYNHDRFRLSHDDVGNAVSRDEAWVRRNNAWVRIDRKRFDSVSRAIKETRLERTPTGFRFPASRQEEIIKIFSRLGSIEHSESYARFLAQLADFEKIDETPLPRSLRQNIKFRPYQQHGYNWLAFLRKYGLNGILADDMGLGKTLQTLASLRHEQELTGLCLPSLVICPTSLVMNWKIEAGKFFDGIDVRTYVGTRRDRALDGLVESERTLFEADAGPGRDVLVITSFGIALRDHAVLSGIEWLYVIIDEAHQIKNPSAQRTRAIKTINGQYKLALTGTPIQNRLDELWSLFDFVMPGYLGSSATFRKTYSAGSKVNWDAVHDSDRGLKAKIHPFVLRRLKTDVAKDLPDKVLITLPVELTPEQVRLYKEAQNSVEFKRMTEALATKGAQRASTEILAAYTRFRTICNHPALDSNVDAKHIRVEDSGKLEALKELIQEVREGDHRALIFCQSTRMLDIIGNFFKEWDVPHLRLDGTTVPATRQQLVDRFNADTTLAAFLISTKAGGTGLNLTGADTVIFYDHDWNPANDQQAQDRAYRIGQTRTVTVYRLVSIGTIEEKIIERQEMKQSLADQIVGNDSDGFKDLTKEQLLTLFEFRA